MKELTRSHIDIILSLSTVFCVFFVDRLTKMFFSNLLFLGESLIVIKKFFHFTLVHNTGIAFGLFRDHGAVFIIVPLIACVLLVYNIIYYRKEQNLTRTYIVSFSMIVGGALGNLFDRIIHGYVIDFIDFRVWPVFNIADSAITVGAVIILFKCIPSSVKH